MPSTADRTADHTAERTTTLSVPVTWHPRRSGVPAVGDGRDVTDRLEEALVDEDG